MDEREGLRAGQEITLRAVVVDPSVRTAYNTVEVKFPHGGTNPVYVDKRDVRPPVEEAPAPTLFPRNKLQPANGWILDFQFLKRIKNANPMWDLSEGEVEAVLLSAERDQAKGGKEG